ncbi:MAG: hypothetical protein HY226_02720 [Candidatus Vogelbacteria bacterium]|nr:hypothetical protein [Candidatus Vogelbacteria bacterium]
MKQKNESKKFQSRYSPVLRTISALVILTFVSQDFAQAQGGTPVWSHVIDSQPKNVLPKNSEDKLNNIAIPFNSGLARKVAVQGTNEIIINIQDAHSKLGAQESITKILDNLVKNYDLKLIALEGSSDLVDTSLVSSFPIQEVKKKTGEYLMKEGKISAGEFYSMISESPVSLYGVDDPSLYQENVEVFKDLIDKKLQIRQELKALKATLHELETKVYSPKLQELVSKKLLHKNGDIKFTEYWDYFSTLAKEKGVDYTKYPNLKKLADTVDLEKEINFKKAGEERDALIRELGQKLPKADLEKLVLAALQYKQSKITPGSFHYTLSQLSQGVDINPLNYKNIILYSEYVVLYESIDLITIFDEVELFENSLKETLYKTQDERDLSQLTHCINILSQLLDTSLNSKDYEFFVKNEASCEIDAIESQTQSLSFKTNTQNQTDFKFLKSAIPSAKRFYELASKRNQILLQNTLKKMREEHTNIAALITGGFHSEGISKLMDEEKLSYLVVMPKFDEKSADRPYIAILTQKPKEYEEQFKDSEFYLATGARSVAPFYVPSLQNEDTAAILALAKLEGLGSRLSDETILKYTTNLTEHAKKYPNSLISLERAKTLGARLSQATVQQRQGGRVKFLDVSFPEDGKLLDYEVKVTLEGKVESVRPITREIVSREMPVKSFPKVPAFVPSIRTRSSAGNVALPSSSEVLVRTIADDLENHPKTDPAKLISAVIEGLAGEPSELRKLKQDLPGLVMDELSRRQPAGARPEQGALAPSRGARLATAIAPNAFEGIRSESFAPMPGKVQLIDKAASQEIFATLQKNGYLNKEGRPTDKLTSGLINPLADPNEPNYCIMCFLKDLRSACLQGSYGRPSDSHTLKFK